MSFYAETPIQRIQSAFLEKAGIRLLVKREDLNHSFVSGNKWWKLKYNLIEAHQSGYKKILTLGGAYSNHIYATAAAAKENGLASIGIIRGEKTVPLNSILTFAKSQGMLLHYVSRDAYSRKSEPGFMEQLISEFGEFYLIPEGGTNRLAIKGCEEFGTVLAKQEFDFLCLPAGTGGTLAGIAIGLAGEKRVIGYSVLKGGEFLTEDVKKLIFDYTAKEIPHWEINSEYHFGGYAKTNRQLNDFMDSFQDTNTIPIEPVYTAKMFFGILDQVKKDLFPRGSTLLALHTGGVH